MATYTNQAASKDARIQNHNNTTNYGSEESVYTRIRSDRLSRVLIEFDISDFVGTKESIDSASLFLYYWAGADSPAGCEMYVYKLIRDFVELEATWDIWKNGNNWGAAGASQDNVDYESTTPTPSLTIVPGSAEVWMEWDIKAIVEDAIDNEADKVRITIRQLTGHDDDLTYWWSRDWEVENLHPKLEIEYTVGEETQTLTPTGITSLESFGTPTAIPGSVLLEPTGVASLEAFGTPIASGYNLLEPTGIASLESFGTPTASGYNLLTPTGIASLEAFGVPVVEGYNLLEPTGISSLEAFGTPTAVPGSVLLEPTGVASLEAFGTPTIVATYVLEPTGITSLEAFGTPTVVVGSVLLEPTGIASLESFGTPTIVMFLLLAPTGISSVEVFGTSTVVLGTWTLTTTGIASLESFGTAWVINSQSRIQVRSRLLTPSRTAPVKRVQDGHA